ncbi:MAG TPA: ATP-binding protein [Candidatus Limnocylindrales bacterium]|jgi:signal transduction histidine kinase|nr:ATP-binding protein [Candidatus Limnocylindrales bacterium]
MDLRLDEPARRRLTLVLAAVIIVAGWTTLLLGKFDSGVRLTWTGENVVVADVMPGSIAAQYGLQPGMVVTQLQYVTLIEMPHYVEPDPAMSSPDPDTGQMPPPTIQPATPTPVDVDPDLIASLLSRPPTQLAAVQPWDLDRPGPSEEPVNEIMLYDDGMDGIRMTMPAFAVGVILLVLVGWWLASGRAGQSVRGLAGPLALGTAAPFMVRPMLATYSLPLVVLSGLLLVLAMIPLAVALLERIPDPNDRRLVGYGNAGCVVAAGALFVLTAFNGPWYAEGITRWALVAAIPLLPGLAAAGPIDRRTVEGTAPAPASRRLLESAEYAVVGATPAFALASDVTSPPYAPFPLLFWFALVLLAGRFTIRPLARIATRATLQRDLVVAATEAERARVAADIHDDALQELTLLVHRLDAAGDAEGADIARTVSDRLRAICGDLRLPILDDLGVGPALDWLVLRIERLAGGEVRLERADGTRPPADVELAFFRVAQEALSNAVKHGKPPILVRYATTPGGASLSIDDAGPGIDPDATTTTDRTGHFGLLNMQQRAEAIGAILDVRRWPSGGTHVALDWRAG